MEETIETLKEEAESTNFTDQSSLDLIIRAAAFLNKKFYPEDERDDIIELSEPRPVDWIDQ